MGSELCGVKRDLGNFVFSNLNVGAGANSNFIRIKQKSPKLTLVGVLKLTNNLTMLVLESDKVLAFDFLKLKVV